MGLSSAHATAESVRVAAEGRGVRETEEQGPRLAHDGRARDEGRLARARAPRRPSRQGPPGSPPDLVRLSHRGERGRRDREGPGRSAAERERPEARRTGLTLPKARGEDLKLLAVLRDRPPSE